MDSIMPRNGQNDEFDDNYPRPEREFTLGTTMILGLFFALAIVCAGFFAFGYQLGRRSVPSNPVPSATPATGTFSGFKPAPGSPLTTPDPKPAPVAGPTVAVPYTPPPTPVKDDIAQNPVDQPAPPAPSPQPVPRPTPPAATPAPTPSGGTAMVQIAAVSHQEDADLLVTSLKHRGYNVAIHPGAQDGLLHVQIGPFPTHKDADAMRQRLLNDGFNAIVKDAH